MINYITEYLLSFANLLKNKNILKIIFLSFLFAILLVAIIFFYFWNLAPSLSWAQIILGSFYDDMLKIFWKFVIFSVLIFLIPPFFSIIVSFFLDDIVEEVYFTVSKNKNVELKTLSYLSGIIISIKIFLYALVIFLLIIFLKVFIISNNLLILSIQFLLSSYVIAKEYGELITYKLCIRNPNLVSNIKNGLLCNILFCLPIINIIAPVLTTVIITNKLIKERSL